MSNDGRRRSALSVLAIGSEGNRHARDGLEEISKVRFLRTLSVAVVNSEADGSRWKG